MRRIVTVVLSTITTLVLLLSYHTSTDSAMVVASPVTQTPVSSGPAPSASSPSPASSSKPSPPTSAATYTGDVANTEWGPVQVRITVRGNKITASEAVMYPQGNGRDAQINGYALPVLNKEVVQAQRATIDTVSGATVTSDGYLQSLQSAIDRAHL